MQRLKKLLLGLLAGVVVMSGCLFSVSAAETAEENPSQKEDGISVQIVSDKEEYAANDIVTVTTIVTNTNNFTVRNVSIASSLPDGFILTEDDPLSLTQDELKAGESMQLSVKVKVKADGSGNGGNHGNSNEGPAKTGVSAGIISGLLTAALASGCIFACVVIGKKKKWKKTMALLLCGALSLSSLGMLSAFAAEPGIEVSKALKFGQKQYLFSSTVNYEISEDQTTPPAVSKVEKVHVKFGDTESETAAKVSTVGSSEIVEVSSSVGALEDAYTVRTLSGKGSSIRFEASLKAGADATIEFQEIHQREDAFFGYDVYVNSQKVYTRTYEPLSDGPNHFFVEVDASLLNESGANTIEVKNQTDGVVRFQNVWVYSDFAAVLKNENVYRPMQVSLFTPNISYKNYESDLEAIRALQAEYSDYDMYALGMGFDFLYMHYETKELQRRLDWLMRLSVETGIPFHLSVNSWWGGTPHGYDGKGNLWTDILYNQVVYDPLNLGGTGEWRLSTPNQWSNTPWLTMNNEYYNKVRENRVTEVAEYISAKSAEYRVQGQYVPPMTIFTENEPLYWTYSAFNSSPDARADFNAAVVEAAAKDGITLNPEDGLSDKEKMWMYKNLNRYVAGIGKAMANGLKHDAVVIDNGEISYPDYQLIENAYSHMFIQYDDPISDMKQGMWENHMLDDIRFGGEWAEEQDSRYLDYIAARGRFSDVNAERGSIVITNHTLLEQAYAAGSNHVTIYNFADGDNEYIGGADQAADRPVTAAKYARTAAYMDFNTQNLKLNNTLIAMEDVHTEALGFQYVLTPSKQDGSSVTFRIDDGGKALEHGVLMKLGGRILSSMNANCKIEIYAGASEDELKLADTISEITPNAIDLSGFIDKAATEAYVKLVMHTSDNSTLYSWVSLKNVAFQLPSGLTSGQTSGEECSYKEARTHNLWVTYRADAERMLKNYEEAAGRDANYKQAAKLIDDCNYVSAYNYLVQILSETLPAKYAVKGSGALGKYPVEIQVENPDAVVEVTLLAVGDSLKLSLKSEDSEKVSLSWKDIKNGTYALKNLGDGAYEIAAAKGGAIEATEHRLSVALTAEKYYSKDYPDEFAAIYKSYDKDRNTLSIQSHNSDISEYVNSVSLDIAEDVTLIRGQFGAEESSYTEVPLTALVAGDMLELKLNAEDQVVEMKASYGVMKGTVVSVEYPKIKGEAANAFITIKNAEGKEHRFEIGSEAVFDYPSRTGSNILTAAIGNYGLEAGDDITVLYIPYNENRTDGLYRVLKLTQPSEIILDETFETDSWKDAAFEKENLATAPLDTNNPYKVLYPATTNTPSHVTWKLDNNGKAFGWINVQFSGRCIMGSHLKWSYSYDNSSWTTISEWTGSPDWQSNTTKVDLLLENIEASVIYIRCDMVSGSDTWSSINDITIKKMASDSELMSAVLSSDVSEVDKGAKVPFDLVLSYDDNTTSGPSGANVSFVISNPEVLSYSDEALNAVKEGTTDLYAIVEKNGKTVVSNSITITVNKVVEIEWNTLFDYDFEDLENLTAEIPGVADSQNVQIEELDPAGGILSKGITNTLVPNSDPSWSSRQEGYVVYKIDAPQDVFQYLKINYAGRHYKNTDTPDSSVTFLVSEDQSDWTPVETMPENQPPTSYSFDLTNYAKGKATVYLKVSFGPSRLTWTWLDSIAAVAGMEKEAVVIDWNTPLFSYDYEDLEEYATEIPGAVDSQNVQIEELEKTAGLHDKGISGALNLDGAAGEEHKLEGYVVYALTAPDAGVFEHLKLSYSGRAIMGAAVTFSVSDDRKNWTKAGEMPNDGAYQAVNELDISKFAKGKQTIYVKITLSATRYTWSWLNSFAATAGSEVK